MQASPAEPLADPVEADGIVSDATLIDAVRAGDTEAYGVLFERHRAAAERLSRQLVSGIGADDLVAEAFVKVLSVLQRGGGPDAAFRAYLLTSLRRLHIDSLRATKREQPTEDEADLDRLVEFVDPAEMAFERGAAGAAFATLPERWQLVLWHLDVEGQTPAEIAPLLGMAPNSISALAYRAREGLRRAYLQQHLAPTLEDDCRATTGKLGSHVRQGLSARDTRKVEAHLDQCARCTGLYLELREVNANLAGILGPALLGTAAAGYLGATGTISAVGLIGAGTAAGMAFSTQAVLVETARIVTAPARLAVAGSLTGSAPAVVATVAVAGAASVGVVATTTDIGSADPTPSLSVLDDPRHDPTDDGIRIDGPSAATPDPVTAPDEDDEPEPPEPVAEVEPQPIPPEATDPEPEPEDASGGGSSEPEPEPAPVPVVGTDFALGAPVTVKNDRPALQRTLTVPITGTTTGGDPADRTVSIRIAFDRKTIFRSVDPDWTCDVEPGQVVRSELVCTTIVPAGQETTPFRLTVAGIRPAGTLTLDAEADPETSNNQASFTSTPILLLF